MPESFGLQIKKDSFCFTAAHFLTFADGSREELHGHNYCMELRLEGDVDETGLLVDFLVLIPLMEKICRGLDRRTLLPKKNPHLRVETSGETVSVRHRAESFTFPKRDTVLLPLANTSTELLAAHLAREIRAALTRISPPPPLRSLEVRLEEASGQGASCRLSFPPAASPPDLRRSQG